MDQQLEKVIYLNPLNYFLGCDLSPSQSDMYNQGNFPENLLIEKKQINFGAQIDFIKSPKSLTKNRTTLNDTYKNQKTSTINRSLISPESEQTYSINQNELEIFNKLQDQSISKSNLEESQTDLKNSLIEFEDKKIVSSYNFLSLSSIGV